MTAQPRLTVRIEGELTLARLAEITTALNDLHREICRSLTGNPDAVPLIVTGLQITPDEEK